MKETIPEMNGMKPPCNGQDHILDYHRTHSVQPFTWWFNFWQHSHQKGGRLLWSSEWLRKFCLKTYMLIQALKRLEDKDVTWVFVKWGLCLGNRLAGSTPAFCITCPYHSDHDLFHKGNFLRVQNSSWTMETVVVKSFRLRGDASLSKLSLVVRVLAVVNRK